VRRARWILGAALLLGGSAPAGALTVLAPADQARVRGDRAWLVVVSSEAPGVTLDGRRAGRARDVAGAYHLRVEGLRAEGSRLEVAAEGSVVTLTVYGAAGAESGFHRSSPQACSTCHRVDASGCKECHQFEGAKHRPVLQKGCTPCHVPPDWQPQDPAPLCAVCHPDHGEGRHPRLRHPLRSARDPLRPGRSFDCASCHDPHAPQCLACLGREEMRSWCKGCHGSP